MKTLKNYLVVLIFSFSLLALSSSVRAQNVGINSKGNKPSSDAVLDLRTGNLGSALGFLPNEVSLSATNSASPFTTPDTGLIVYNYAISGTAPYNVVPGYYYWTGSAWVMMLAPSVGTSGQVLTSNGGGAPSWTTISTNSGWSLTGNSGTTVGTNFIGTTNAQPLEFKVDGSIAGYIDYSGVLANAAFGYQALYSNNNNGISNSAFGYQALYANTTGSNNVATGIQALCYNTYGSYNVAIGQQTLFNGTTGDFNVAVGNGAMSSGVNTGYYNTAIGNSALNDNISGTENIAIGDNPLAQNTTGSNNIGIGNNALNRSNGSYNIGTGYQALLGNITGSYNIATGDSAMWAGVNTGIQNIATGSQALYNNSSGSGNIGVGYRSLANNTTGSYNTALGYNAGVASGALTNATAIGYNATVSASNTMVMGDNSVTQFEFNGALMPYYSSAYNAGTSGQVLTSQGAGAAPQWITPTVTTYIAGTGIEIQNDSIINTSLDKTVTLTGTGGTTITGTYPTFTVTSTAPTSYIAGTGIKISNDTISNTQSSGAVNYVGTSYLGITSGRGSTGTSEGTSSNLYNINIGDSAGNNNTIGNSNILLGYDAGNELTSGNSNIAIGSNSLVQLQTTNNNIAIGNQACYSPLNGYTTQDGIIGIGYQALDMLQANGSVAIGYQSQSQGTSASFNSTSVGYQSLYQNNNANNTGIGYKAGYTIGSGSNSTFIGYQANASSGSLINATAIGANATVDSSNTITLGDNAVIALEMNGALKPYYSGKYNAGTSGQVLTSQGSDVAPKWVTPMVTNYIAGTGIEIQNDSIINTSPDKTVTLTGTGGTTITGTYPTFTVTSTAPTTYIAGTGIKISNDTISNTKSTGAVNYVGTSYLGITSGRGSNGTSEGTSSNLYNINVGDSAGASNVIGTNNIAIGDQALRANDRINSLVAIGTGALATETYQGGTSVDGDIGIGYKALNTATISNYNVAIGYESQSNVTNDISGNTSVGYQAGANLSGDFNSVFGKGALSLGSSGTAGYDCVFGTEALKNDNGGYNNAFGFQALFHNSNGQFNVANGNQALYNNTNGNNNVSMGTQALFANTTGNNNTAYGYDAMYAGTTGSYNLAMGDSALGGETNTGNLNIAIGSQTLYNNTSGHENIAIGDHSLYSNQAGSGYIAIGYGALSSNSGLSNSGDIAIGINALGSELYYGSENVVIGYEALSQVEVPTDDVVIGYQAEANNNTNHGQSTAVGYQALYNDGSENNSALGYQAGKTSNSGTGNTFIGASADVSTDGFSNATAIGYNAKVSSSNTILLGNNSVTSTEFNGALMPYYSSAFNAGTSGQVLESKGAGVAPQWVTPTSGTVTGSGTSTQIAFWSGSSALSSNSNLYWDNTNDRLGIGTSSPTAVLHTVASGAKTAAYSGNLLTNSATSSTASIKKAGVEIQSTGSWTGTSASNIGLYVSSTTGGTNNYDAIFNGGGNVGIGTTTPSALLEVAGTGQYIGQFQSSYTDGTWITLNNTSTGGTGWNIISTGQNNGEGAGNLLFNTASGGDAMIIQSSNGYVGIGTSTPAVPLDVYQYGQSLSGTNSTAIQPYSIFRVDGSTGAGVIDMGQLNTGSFAGWIQASYSSGTNPLSLNPQGGNVGIGTTSPTTLLYVTGSTASGGYIATVANTTNASNAPSNGINILAGANSYTSGSTNFVSCKTPNGTQIGSINQSSTTSVSFNTTSDERLKENIIPTKYGINDLMKIQIKDYTYKGDNGQNQQTGYLAQQLYTVFPNAVHVGGADAKTDPWMVDYGRITPLLVKSIQDQQQIIDEQNKKLDAYQQQMTAQQKQIDELKQMMEQMQKNKN